MYYLVYLFSTESWLRSTTTTKRETRIEEKKKNTKKEKRWNEKERDTIHIHTHTCTHTHTLTRETRERHARKRDGRMIASVRARAKRRNALANFYAEAVVARCDFDTRDIIFFRIYTHLHAYTDTRTTHVYTYVRYIHTEREERSVKAGRHCWSHTRTHIYK